MSTRRHQLNPTQAVVHLRPVMLWVCLGLLGPAVAKGQPSVALPDAASPASDYLQQQIVDLSDPSYRARQLARWRLEQAPLASIEAIRQAIHSVDYNAGAQLVDLLSSMAMHSDVSISLRARRLLGDLSQEVSSIGRLASNTLGAIADLQEEKAIQVLTFHGAYIGPQNFGVNGRSLGENLLALRIDEKFDGDDAVIQWIRFLKSVESVYFLGAKIDARHYRAISELPQIKVIKLKHVTLTREELKLFSNLLALEHLGLNYVQVDDTYIPELLELPVSQSLRLYGTRITANGEALLNKQLDGIEIYRGNGGFLGVGTPINSTIVTSVSPGSAAHEAGIDQYDRLTHINNVPIATFDDLRNELGKLFVGDPVEVRLRREGVELVLTAHLGEDPN